MAMYTLKKRIYIDENDEIYICQKPLLEDDETIGRRMQSKVTMSRAAKAYPCKHADESPRRQAVIISHHAPFKPTSKKKVEEITARLTGSSTFATKMRSSDAPSEPVADACPKSTHPTAEEDKVKDTPRNESPRPAKSVLKKTPRNSQPPTNRGRPNNGQTSNVKSTSNPTDKKNTGRNNTQNNRQIATRKSVRFDSAKSKSSQKSSEHASRPTSGSKKPGAFLRLLLDEG